MTATPILFLGDSPSYPSGLGRIGRDLAVRLSALPEFRVGYLGRGGCGSSRFNFSQYFIPANAPDFGESVLEEVWWDFAGVEHGIIFSINDASRMLWFAQPDYCQDEVLKRFLTAGHFKRWGYFPIDGTGPSDRLTGMSRDVLRGYDRVLAYTDWAAGVIERTADKRPPSLPHGLDLSVFKPHDRRLARAFLSPALDPADFLVGIVATNQSRKDWGLGLTVCASLMSKIPKLRVWIHIDTEVRAWSIPALVQDLGLGGRVILTTTKFTDAEMAQGYSACDITLGIGNGEGFGYPLVESLACGVPVVHGRYAGGAEFVPPENLVDPVAWRLETICNRVAPVFRPEDWVEKILGIHKYRDREEDLRMYPEFVEHLDWSTLWPRWESWFKEGLQ